MYFYMENNFKDFKNLKFYILKVLKQNVSSLVKYFFLIFFFFSRSKPVQLKMFYVG